MKKYKVSYKNTKGVIIEKTFNDIKKATKLIKDGIEFGIEKMTIEEFKITEK